MLDGAARVEGPGAGGGRADGQPALGITDHGNMYGVLDFYKACRGPGITPIIGTEAYMAADSRHERPVRRGRVDDTGGDVEGGQKLYYHLTLLAETTQGYRNLLKLSSAAYLEGYYYKPRVDWELLERYHEGLVATTGCLGGRGAAGAAGRRRRRRRPGGRRGCRTSSGATTSSSSSRTTASPTRRRTNPQLVEIARRIGAPLLATNDSHYTPPRATPWPTTRCCACRPAPLIDDPKRFKFEGDRALPEVGRRDAPPLRARSPRRATTRCWIAERADVDHRVREADACPSSRSPTEFAGADYEERATAYLRDLTYAGRARALRRRRSPTRSRDAARLRARGHRGHGLLAPTSSSSGT